MKTFKYYRVPNTLNVPINEELEIYPYTEDGTDKIVGVLAENHSSFEDSVDCAVQTFEEVEDLLKNSHLNKELDRELKNKIKEKYSLDDEIALFHKQESQEYADYLAFRTAIKEEVLAKKITYGLKQGV